MNSLRHGTFALFICLAACTTVNVAPNGQDPIKDGPGSQDPSGDASGTGGGADGSADPVSQDSDNPSPDQDSGGAHLGTDSGGGGTDSGGVSIDSGGGGGGVDSGGGGGGDGGGVGLDAGAGGGSDGGGGGGAVVSNTNNWAGWNSTSQCPSWNPVPYAWKAPKTSNVGSASCSGSALISFYSSYFGPSATSTTRANWDSNFPGCKVCAVSNWSDATWSAVVKTPAGHLILNKGGCYALKDPGRVSCGESSWQYQQCGYEACDTSATQAAYQSCVSLAGGNGGACDQASFGAGMATYVISLPANSSPAAAGCFASGFADNENQTAMRILDSFCN